MRNRFDQFMKQMLWEAFTRAGATERDAEVSPDAQRIDLWFVPQPSRVRLLRPFGLIARMARRPCALEAFHSTPTPWDFDACQRKHFNFRHILARKQSTLPVPLQWVLSAGRPSASLTGFGCRRARGWPRGVYAGPPRLWLRVVVISELPADRSTLLLRLMGAGRVLKRAIAELRALAEDAPERCLALPVLVRLRFEIPEDSAKQTSDDREFLMSTQHAMEIWESKVREEGVRQGEQRAQQALEMHKQKLREEGIRLGEQRARRALEMHKRKLREEGIRLGEQRARRALEARGQKLREEGIRLGEQRARKALEMHKQKLREEGIRLGEQRAQQALEAREQKLREQAIRVGEQQGVALARHAATSMYEVRFGPMPKTLRARVEATQDPAVLASLCDLAAHGSRKEIGNAIRQTRRA